MRIKVLSIAAFLLLAFAADVSAQSCERHTEPSGGFSMCLPDGWTKVLREGRKFHNLLAPLSGPFRANINFRDGVANSSAAKYMEDAFSALVARPDTVGVESVRTEAQTSFTTASGLKGVRAAAVSQLKGQAFRTVQYAFKLGPTKIVIITGTAVDSEKSIWEPVFDKAVASFRAEK